MNKQLFIYADLMKELTGLNLSSSYTNLVLVSSFFLDAFSAVLGDAVFTTAVFGGAVVPFPALTLVSIGVGTAAAGVGADEILPFPFCGACCENACCPPNVPVDWKPERAP